MKASIIIAVYNRTRYLENLLSKIRTWYPVVEIIIVDDGSTKEQHAKIRKLCEEHGAKLIHHKVTLGLSASRNDAIKEANGGILVFLDDDILPIGDWLHIFRRQINNGFSIVCGKIFPLFENGRPYFYNDALEFILGLNSRRHVLLEGATAVKAELFNDIGLFDKDFGRKKKDGMSGEGRQLFNKAIQKGYKTDVNIDAVFYHHVPKEKQSLSYFLKRAWAEGVSDKKAGKDDTKVPFFIRNSIQTAVWSLTNILILIFYISGLIYKKR